MDGSANNGNTGLSSRQPRTSSISNEGANLLSSQQAASDGVSNRNSPNVVNNSGNSDMSRITLLLNKVFVLIAVLLRIGLTPLQYLIAALFPTRDTDGSSPRAADAAARAFASNFQLTYLPPAPPVPGGIQDNGEAIVASLFSEMGYAKCVAEARRSTKLLLVYLHSPYHRDSTTFCRRVLTHPTVINYLIASNGRLMLWGGSIHTGDGLAVSTMLGVSSYPCVALLSCESTRDASSSTSNNSSNTMELLLKLEYGSSMSRTYSSSEFLTRIGATVEAYQSILDTFTARRVAREQEAHLRREQDDEYLQALEIDRLREEGVAREREEVARLEQERVAEEESIGRKKRDRLEAAQRDLNEEPTNPAGTCRIRFTLPTGAKVDRRFYATDTIRAVESFLLLHFENSVKNKIENFGITTNYPKRTFDFVNDAQLTVQEAGLMPQAVIMIQDLDA